MWILIVFQNLTSLLTQASKPAGTALLPLDTCLIPPRGQLMHKLSGHIDTVTDLDICRDGRFVVTGWCMHPLAVHILCSSASVLSEVHGCCVLVIVCVCA